MDEGVAAFVAEDFRDRARLLAYDTPGFVRRIGNQSAAEFAAIGRADNDGIAAVKIPVNTGHTGWQQALARKQRFLGTAVDKNLASGFKLPCDPALFRGHGIGLSQKPRDLRAVGNGFKRVQNFTRGDDHIGAGTKRDLARFDLGLHPALG